EWNYTRQMLHIRLMEAGGASHQEELKEIFGPDFLIERPLLQAIDPANARAPVLLIDELDRSDEEFEAYLLELLSDFQITIPEIGTVTAKETPVVIITSNRTREIHDALRRRCLYYWIDFPTLDKEYSIVLARKSFRCLRHACQHNRIFLIQCWKINPIVQTAAAQCIVNLARAVGCNNHNRRFFGLYRANFRNGNLEVR